MRFDLCALSFALTLACAGGGGDDDTDTSVDDDTDTTTSDDDTTDDDTTDDDTTDDDTTPGDAYAGDAWTPSNVVGDFCMMILDERSPIHFVEQDGAWDIVLGEGPAQMPLVHGCVRTGDDMSCAASDFTLVVPKDFENPDAGFDTYEGEFAAEVTFVESGELSVVWNSTQVTNPSCTGSATFTLTR